MAMFMDKEFAASLGGILRGALQNYFMVASNEKPSMSKTASTVAAEDSDSTEFQWNEHALKMFYLFLKC